MLYLVSTKISKSPKVIERSVCRDAKTACKIVKIYFIKYHITSYIGNPYTDSEVLEKIESIRGNNEVQFYNDDRGVYVKTLTFPSDSEFVYYCTHHDSMYGCDIYFLTLEEVMEWLKFKIKKEWMPLLTDVKFDIDEESLKPQKIFSCYEDHIYVTKIKVLDSSSEI